MKQAKPKVMRTCPNCGDPFVIEVWVLNRPGKGLFCSTHCAGKNAAKRMHVLTEMRPWSEQDVEKLKRLFPITGRADLAAIFQRSADTIATKAKKLNLHKTESYLATQTKRGSNLSTRAGVKAWSEQEVEDLKRLYPDTESRALVAIFNRPAGSITAKAEHKGVCKSNAYKAVHPGMVHQLYPPELKEAIRLAKLITKELDDAEKN